MHALARALITSEISVRLPKQINIITISLAIYDPGVCVRVLSCVVSMQTIKSQFDFGAGLESSSLSLVDLFSFDFNSKR